MDNYEFKIIDKEIRQAERINQISDIRIKNNRCWMHLLRIAWQYAPQEAAKILKEIQENDKAINEITKEMCDEELPRS
jgi:fructose-specific phosphotransferase system component IIB